MAGMAGRGSGGLKIIKIESEMHGFSITSRGRRLRSLTLAWKTPGGEIILGNVQLPAIFVRHATADGRVRI